MTIKRPWLEPFRAAMKMGPLALLRLRAEILLRGGYPLTDAEREELNRVASAPREEDYEWLAQFDRFFEDEERQGS